ncbi:glycoside hydrolase family 26 protein [Pseudohyphozyma bogoriensis]|nr:glycoside hydrolase family 26 protein [Pseudohyphozyma bogoriensis]
MHFSPILALSPLLFSIAAGARHKRGTCNRGGRHSSSSSTSLAASSSSSVFSSPSAVVAAVKHTSTGTASATNDWSSKASSSTASSSAAKASSTSSSSSTTGWGLGGTVKNNIYFGVLPDDGSGAAQATAQTMDQLLSAAGVSQSGTTFDGSQLLSRKDMIVAAGGVFQPAVMPTGGWQGLTSSDNSQAVAICNVLQEFVDAGMEVWLRFAHEVNWYQSDGTYQGGVDDFKAGWAAVAAECQPKGIKMWFTPNVADESTYDEYFPDDIETVDLIGIDYYPTDSSSSTFLGKMQAFHDKYTSETTKFAIGETGLSSSAGLEAQLVWAKSILSAEVNSAMPHFIAMSWFNYDKEEDFRILGKSGDSSTKAWLA